MPSSHPRLKVLGYTMVVHYIAVFIGGTGVEPQGHEIGPSIEALRTKDKSARLAESTSVLR